MKLSDQLRHDLNTCGWSMVPMPGWASLLLGEFNDQGGKIDFNSRIFGFRLSDSVPCCESDQPYSQYLIDLPIAPPATDRFTRHLDSLLHEALFDEDFGVHSIEQRTDYSYSLWHQDGGYLRALFACRGLGTKAALSFDNNVETPEGYALILTGQERSLSKGVPWTWHCGPQNHEERQQVVVNFSIKGKAA